MAPPQVPPSSAALAGRIQGFGNVNPPPLPEEDAKTVAKRAAGRLGAWVGEEMVMTVQDFKEKGAVGALKDATLDAGDMLIDGVAGVFGWIRGDPPPQEELDEKHSEDAQKILANAPAGAAYGVSQASPTGGINAVWVMPHEADPATLAQLAAEKAAAAPPPGIQPYMGSSSVPPGIQPYMPQHQTQIPGGGPMIAPYDPNASKGRGAAGTHPGFPGVAGYVPGAPPAFPGTAGFVPGMQPGFPGYGQAGATGGLGRVKSMVEQVAQGGSIVGPELVKRLLSTCASTQVSAEELAEAIAERCRRIYLGLDGGSSSSDADGALARLLALADQLAQDESPLAKTAAALLGKKAGEEFGSLQSSAKHRTAAEPMLRRLGLFAAPAAQTVDLLGAEVDLLGVGTASGASAATPASTDLLGF